MPQPRLSHVRSWYAGLASAEQRVAKAVAGMLSFNLLFAAFLLIRPGSRQLVLVAGDLGLTLGLLAAAALWLTIPVPLRALLAGFHAGPRRFMPLLLGLGVLLGAVTAGFFAWYDLILHRTIPPASPADIAFVAAHLFAVPTLLLLPTRRTHGLMRARIVLDGVLVLAAVITFSSYFILGPLVVHSDLPALGKVSQTAYPLSDLFLIICVLLLLPHFENRSLRPTVLLLSLGLLSLVITDSFFDYQRLHHGYHGASLLDIGWLFGGSCVGLAAMVLRAALAGGRVPVRDAPEELASTETGSLHLWRTLIPTALMAGVVLSALYLWFFRPNDPLALPVYYGAASVVLLALARQLLAALESSRLIGRLEEAYHAALDHAGQVQQLNADLARARDAVEARNQALAEANVRLEQLATHDVLTGLANRTLFRDRLAHDMALARRDGRPVAVGIIDLDAFKDINDSFGHSLGDYVIQQVGRRLPQVLRATDTAARIGGDEFAIILPDTDSRAAAGLAARILACINQPFMVGGRGLEIDASLGLALFPEHGSDDQSLMQRADAAMYHAKRNNVGFAVYDQFYDEHGLGRRTLAAELRRAIEGEGLMLNFQPIVRLRDGTIDSWEALLRWYHPEHGNLPPDEFIPLAERTGLIGPLTEWVLTHACEQWIAWSAEGQLAPIAVNLSPRCLFDDRILECITGLCALLPGREWLQIEITEGSLIAEPDRAAQLLEALHDLGVTIAIDDFGTGYSSLARLRHLPVDEIKIDRSFVTDMHSRPDDLTIVRSIVELAHHLGLRVTAEGVENQRTADTLSVMGCDLGQGNYFGRPAPAAQIGVAEAITEFSLTG